MKAMMANSDAGSLAIATSEPHSDEFTSVTHFPNNYGDCGNKVFVFDSEDEYCQYLKTRNYGKEPEFLEQFRVFRDHSCHVLDYDCARQPTEEMIELSRGRYFISTMDCDNSPSGLPEFYIHKIDGNP